MEKLILRHNAIIIFSFYMMMAINFTHSPVIDKLLHVPSLVHKAQAEDVITARDDVAPPDYKYRASEFNRLTDKLAAPRVGE